MRQTPATVIASLATMTFGFVACDGTRDSATTQRATDRTSSSPTPQGSELPPLSGQLREEFKAYRTFGDTELLAGRFDTALAYYRRAFEVDPNNAEVCGLVAYTLVKTSPGPFNLEEASKLYLRAAHFASSESERTRYLDLHTECTKLAGGRTTPGSVNASE